MAVLKGFRANSFFKHAATWGTPTVGGATDGLEFMNESVAGDGGADDIDDESISGSDLQREADAGNRMFSGPVTFQARYEGLEPISAHMFGTAGAPTTIDTSAKQHDLKLNADMEGIFGTFAIDKKVKIHEFDTVKVTGFSLKAAQNKRTEVTYRLAARDFTDASAVNTSATFASVTMPAAREFLQFSQLVLRVNAQGGAGLASPTDNIYVTEFNIDFERNYRTDEVTTEFGNRISEPLQNGWGSVTGSLTYARFSDAAPGGNQPFVAGAMSKTKYKLDAKWTAASLAGAATEKFSWTIFLPMIQFGRALPVVAGPGVPGWTQPFRAYRVTAAPTGMTGFLGPGLRIVSTRAGDPLL
jgi:hypothetical protein